MDFRYQHPEFFVALAAVLLTVLLFGYTIRWKSAAIKKIGDPQLVKELVSSHSPRKFLVKFILAALALICVIVAVADPWKPGKMDKVERKGVDVMIALDVSNSMLAQDIQPDRLTRAKQIVLRLLDLLEDDRVGLVVFAGRGYLQMPLTTDHGAARMYVQNASPEMVPTQGTMISEALNLCAAAFNSRERKYKSIVLITDGEDHDPASLQIAERLADNGIIINTIGIGSATATPVPNPYTGEYRKDASGNTVLSKLNEAELQQLSSVTHGVYIGPDEIPEANAILQRKMSAIEETAVEDAAYKDYIHYFQWLLGLALLLLIAEFFLPERVMKKVNMRRAMVLVVILFANVAYAQQPQTYIRNGNRLYKEGKFDQALSEYEKAIQQNSTDPIAEYNLGNAYFRNGKMEEAIDNYKKGADEKNDKRLRERSSYNQGVVLSRQLKLEESIEAYKQALRLDPADEDARINLQKALLELRKKQHQEKQKQEKKENRQQQQQEPPPQSKLTKKQVEQLLKALQQREQQVQQKMQQQRSRTTSKPDKDW